MGYITGSFSLVAEQRGWRSRILAALLIVGLLASSAVALGPVDGEGLAATDLERITIGEPAPDFTLEAETGTPVTLSQFRGQKPVILVFYRGHW